MLGPNSDNANVISSIGRGTHQAFTVPLVQRILSPLLTFAFANVKHCTRYEKFVTLTGWGLAEFTKISAPDPLIKINRVTRGYTTLLDLFR